ncbi:Shikimate 5-dehydrogenase I alpha [Mesoflavibacter sp. HG96]|uniref:shikimate dehydrogenase family protein n=1 Tax=unclassified Mesoflavibacter TaxID=2630131 RepID=UPI00140F1DB1|nr:MULTISPECIES: shikimate dehydrogenase [unclassified Mesoflavibacter]QIJ89673.1 Shikimate 5-dehydrogenase I alpha [Mesoflavibacter sp. HG96]QIJ92401.1 Shikimate 5-dehydrogenase I alpha [Mesoflavibacter sp. HG37]
MDKKQDKPMRKFGLIGRNISYSFSQNYFSIKFKDENILDATYQNFDIQSINQFKKEILATDHLAGLNVTIPFKEEIIPLLDKVDKKAKKIGAVNTIKITKKGKTKGYNTDCYGFKKSLKPLLKKQHKNALILGTGGASKAIAYVLKQLNIDYKFVSRTASNNADYTYTDLNQELINNHQIIINCTPVGTYPKVDQAPDIPYQFITSNHILYDLIYNPSTTLFLQEGKNKGATIINGYDMLVFQAEKAWKIWNK